MLLNNGTWFGRLRRAGGMGGIPGSLLANAERIKLWENAQRFGQYKSVPGGYTQANRAIIPTLKTSSFIAVRMVGEGSLAASAYGVGVLSATLTGEGSTAFNGHMGSHAAVNLTGEGSLTGTPRGIGSASVVMDAGARPSAFDIAQEVWQSQAASYNAANTMGEKLNGAGSAGDPMTGLVEGTLTLRDALRALLAVNTGDASGLEGSTMEFMSNDGTKVRVRATYTSGVRTLTLLDVS
jgi:hypothetical protein